MRLKQAIYYLIKNKPPVPTKTSDLTNDSDFTVSDGTYDAMTVGNAEQLLSTKFTEDKTPYLFRSTGGSADVGNREFDTIVGGSVVENQLVQNGNFVAKTAWQFINGTWETNNNIATFTRGSESYASQFYQFVPVINGRKYFVTATVKPSVACRWDTRFEDIYTLRNATANEWLTISHICMATETALYRVNIYSDISNERDTLQIKNVMCIDLTQMFGTDIADYVYQLEQSTAGSGVAYLKSLGYFTDDYYPYNAGEIKSVSGLSSHDMVGFNQWDEEWEIGTFNTTTGVNIGIPTQIRAKNYIPVVADTNYYVKADLYIWIMFFDSDKNVITDGLPDAGGTSANARRAGNQIIKMPVNCAYIRFYCQASYGTTYNHDICINLSDPNRNGEYEPYVKHSYPLDSSLTLMGVLELDNNKIVYNGDKYHSDGDVDERYAIVDLGTLDWYYNTTNSFFYTTALAKANGLYNFVCEKYAQGNLWSSSTDKISMGNSVNGTFYIKNTAYTDATAFKAAMSGVMLVYEKATPTTSQAEPFSTIQICDSNGTEEYVTTGIPVGHETKYPIDLKGKLEKIPLVEPPKTNGTYTLKCTVSGGVPSYSWV